VVLAKVLSQSITELQRGNAMPPDRVCLNVPAECRVWFDREHLAQILNNLLQNAARYASMKKCAISISLYPSSVAGADKNYCDLAIEDDGPGLEVGVQAHLFEPFFTTHAQGTGLGLYLARELATANQASLFAKDEKNDMKKDRGAVFILRMKQVHSPNHYEARTPQDA
jgi:two-component system sensor histidine kinase PilS (NtrC family)